MKFEHVLNVYWSNHFLFNGRINKLSVSLKEFFVKIGGIQRSTKLTFVLRFEFLKMLKGFSRPLDLYPRELLRGLNIILSQISTVNNQVNEVTKLSIIRLYLIKSCRGKAHALGKPNRGQRTWSNAWTAYNSNRPLRDFIRAMQRILKQDVQEEKRDYRRLARKYRQNTLSKLSAKRAKILMTNWF